MDSNYDIWRVWARFLQRWGIKELIISILEAIGPYSILGAQIAHIGSPFMRWSIAGTHLEALATLLEDDEQKQAFIDSLREVPFS
jgi:hypothetical protein